MLTGERNIISSAWISLGINAIAIADTDKQRFKHKKIKARFIRCAVYDSKTFTNESSSHFAFRFVR